MSFPYWVGIVKYIIRSAISRYGFPTPYETGLYARARVCVPIIYYAFIKTMSFYQCEV